MPRNLLLYVAGGLLVLALLVTFLLLPRSKPAEPAAPPAPVKQVYAVTDIPPHIHITYGMLHEMTTTTPRADVATNINDVVGRVPLRLIRRDQPVLRAMLAEKGPEPMHTFAVPPTKRAIGLAFDPRSVARVVTVGDRVDIIAVYKDGSDTVSRTVAQDCEVLATEETFTPIPAANPQAQPAANQSAPPEAPPEKKEILVVVATTPAESQQIVAAGERGSLKIVMRNPRNPLYAELEESWEHPRKPHKHYESIGVVRSQPSSAPRRVAMTPPPPARPVWQPPAVFTPPMVPPMNIGPKPKSVQVVRGTQVQTVQFAP